MAGTNKVFWSTGKIDELIALFQAHPCLYDRTVREYNDKELRMQAMQYIAGKMQISCDDIYRKIVNLRSQFRREKHREVKFLNDGNTEDPASLIKWVHYKQLKFLDAFVTLRNPRNDYVQYSPANGFGDFDDNIEEDVEYDGLDVDEFKVGHDADANMTELASSDPMPYEQNDSSYSSFGHSPRTDRGFKRQRTEMQVFPDRPHHHSVTNTHASDREDSESSQSAVLQKALSHTPKALPSPASRTVNPPCRRIDEDDDDMTFARYIASELRQLNDDNVKRIVKHQIQNLVFEAHCKTSPLLSRQLPK